MPLAGGIGILHDDIDRLPGDDTTLLDGEDHATGILLAEPDRGELSNRQRILDIRHGKSWPEARIIGKVGAVLSFDNEFFDFAVDNDTSKIWICGIGRR